MATDLRAAARLGQALTGELIIDCHGHLGPWFNFHIPRQDAASMVASMDRLGVRAIVASAHAGIGPDSLLGNELMSAATRDFPGRIYGYVTVNPNYSAEEMRRELERWGAEPGFLGVKLHPDMHRVDVDDDRYAPAWEYANARGLPVLTHTGEGPPCGPPQAVKLAERYPQTPILLGHSGLSPAGVEASIEAARQKETIFLDITGSMIHYGLLERMVREAGRERVLFGTDLPFLDPRPQFGRVLFAHLSDEEKRDVLGRNAARVFKLTG